MVRGYQQEEVQQRLIEILSGSKTGLSGVEIAEKLGINRATITKYLNIFAAEGIIQQKNIGNANLWFIDSGVESLQFPQDYFRVKEKFLGALTSEASQQVYQLVRNALHSGADPTKMLSEAIIPAAESVEDLYLKAKIGKSEAKLLNGIISSSIQLLSFASRDVEQKKNATLISADSASSLYCKAASCALGSHGWHVFELGDMSDAIDVMYDLDLQKFLARTWKQKQGLMLILIFSSSEEGAKFFAESANSIKPKFGKNLHIGVHVRGAKKPGVKAEFASDSFDAVLQWADSIAGGMS